MGSESLALGLGLVNHTSLICRNSKYQFLSN